jgi:hypothetical protein
VLTGLETLHFVQFMPSSEIRFGVEGMSIPNAIDHSHLVKAIQHIQVNGIPKRRASTRYDLLYEGAHIPPNMWFLSRTPL